MKYYDPELQNAWNSHPLNRVRIDRAQEKARRLDRAYRKQLVELKSRMSNRAYRLLSATDHPLFDSNLLSFTIGDGITMLALEKYSMRFHSEVEATFLNFHMDAIYKFRYRGVTAISLELPEKKWFLPNDQIGCLLADEVTPAGRESMFHEFLFTSGATVKIKFTKLIVGRRRVNKKSK